MNSTRNRGKHWRLTGGRVGIARPLAAWAFPATPAPPAALAASAAMAALAALAALATLAVMPAWSAPAAANPVVVITREDCLRLVLHRPGPDVAYRPGVAANGDPVTPADLPASRFDGAPAQIIVDLKQPLGQVAGGTAQSRIAGSDVHLGQIQIGLADGSVRLNGQPVDDATSLAVLEACRRAGVR